MPGDRPIVWKPLTYGYVNHALFEGSHVARCGCAPTWWQPDDTRWDEYEPQLEMCKRCVRITDWKNGDHGIQRERRSATPEAPVRTSSRGKRLPPLYGADSESEEGKRKTARRKHDATRREIRHEVNKARSKDLRLRNSRTDRFNGFGSDIRSLSEGY